MTANEARGQLGGEGAQGEDITGTVKPNPESESLETRGVETSHASLVDCHSHTYLCKHAEMIDPRGFLHVAKQMGFTRVAFCDHCFFPGDDYDLAHRMSMAEVPLFDQLYVKQCEEAALLGMEKPFRNLETDWAVLNPQKSIDLITKYLSDYDGVIGSIHFNDSREVQEIYRLDVDEFLALYRKQFLAMANSGLVQGVAHFDFFKSYNWKIYKLIGTPAGMRQIDDWIVETISQVTNPNFAVEINTSAKLKDPQRFETFVDRYVITQLAKKGVKMYLGSDAHYIRQMGYNFDEMFAFLQSVGVETLYYFDKKRVVGYSVSEARKLYRKQDSALTQQISQRFALE